MRNTSRRLAGASKVSKPRITAATLGLLNPRKRQRMRQEQEVYHHLYREKLEKLVKVAIADRVPELQNVPTSTDDENDSDDGSDEQDAAKGTSTANSLKKIRALRMKIRREVRAEAWANETAEVRREVKEAMIHEREGVAEIKDDEDKVGLDRSPESREL